MKRTILLGALLAAAATAACTPVQNSNANSNQPSTNANAATTPTPAPTVSANDIIDKEKQLWDAIKRKDWDAFGGSLADDQVYVSSNGVHDKAATLESVRKLDVAEWSMTDVKVLMVDADAAVVTYTSSTKGNYDGKPIEAGTLRESSAWVKRGGKWLTVYHQDSEVQTAPAQTGTPSAAPTSSAAAALSPSATASPSASATPATATDAERQVWDALKRKDWDGFAAFLADDFIEVEPDGVYDKAGSVNGVRKVDFTDVTVSDFREVKFDADAALVTHMAKGPREFGPKGMRHTSVWANRGGKWSAVFHQGTMVE